MSIDTAGPQASVQPSSVRLFETGATRDTDVGKPDYEGYLSPRVLHRFGVYMTKHRFQSDGTERASDNWQKGIPRAAYMKSAWRHFVMWWTLHRRDTPLTPGDREDLEETLCGLLFNVQGYLHETLKEPDGHQ